jgi:hypothetical protein
MMSNDALILDLATDLAPVRRRSVRRETLWLLALAATELGLILMAGAMRPDMRQVILSPYMLWKMGSLMLLAAASCTVAMRSFVPPAAPRRGLLLALGLAAVAGIGGVFVAPAADSARSLVDRLSPANGLLCAAAIIVLSAPLMAMLGVLMRRGAPVDPKRSALAVGLAASTCGALIFAFCCPMNDPLYIVVWYALGVAVVTVTARWLLPRRFRL